MADGGVIERAAETLIPGDRVRYGSILLLCDRVAVSGNSVTVEGIRITAQAADTATGPRETLSLALGERVRALTSPPPSAPQKTLPSPRARAAPPHEGTP